MRELIEKLKREALEGGELKDLPCPLCGKPRSQRSDYVRCQPCGKNWLDGEDLTKDPRLSREPYLTNARNRGIQSSKTETPGTA
jgi:hypothetical protein